MNKDELQSILTRELEFWNHHRSKTNKDEYGLIESRMDGMLGFALMAKIINQGEYAEIQYIYGLDEKEVDK